MEIVNVPDEKKPVGRPPKRTAFAEWLSEHPEWTKERLAKELSRSKSHIYALINGTQIPDRVMALAIEHLAGFEVARWERLKKEKPSKPKKLD